MTGILNEISYEYYFQKVKGNKVVTLTRIRNESLILEDFLDHVSTFSDAIIVFDDDSNDQTLEICRNHKKVCAIIRNRNWSSVGRSNQETLHRDILNKFSDEFFDFSWKFYLDADERLVGNIREDILKLNIDEVHYIRIPLYDAYLTEHDNKAFTNKSTLLNGRKYFGIERRDIIFAWNVNAKAEYILDDAREPSVGSDQYITIFACQHYGKAISSDKWDQKCHYYIDNFPYEVYGKKWTERLGRSIHKESDFSTPLYPWGEVLFSNSQKIHPID